MRRYAAGIFLVLLIWTSLGSYQRKLKSSEITRFLSESQVTGYHELHGYAFERTYYTDGTFEQQRRGRPDQTELGQWWVQQNDICIRWDVESRNLCRTIHTNDRGDYWKQMIRRNGDRATVLTYDRVIDRHTGMDKRIILHGLDYALTVFFSPIGMGYLLMFGSAAAYLGHWYVKHRRKTRVTLLGRTFRRDALHQLSSRELQRFISNTVREEKLYATAWGYEALCSVADSTRTAFQSTWVPLKRLNDDQKAINALTSVFDSAAQLPTQEDLLAWCASDPQLTFVLGSVFYQLALKNQSVQHGEALFEGYKEQALAFFELLRSDAPGPSVQPPSGASSDHNYHVTVGPLVQKLVYLKHYPVPIISKKRRSSSYAGGG